MKKINFVGVLANVCVLASGVVAADSEIIDLGQLSGGAFMYGLSLSDDGLVAAGYGRAIGPNDAFRWTREGGAQSIVVPDGAIFSYGIGISDNGQAIVGYDYNDNRLRAFRWIEGQGSQVLGSLDGTFHSYTYATNLDGSVVVGSSEVLGRLRPTRWDSAGVPVDLGLPNGFVAANALGVNSDGTVVVGRGFREGSPDRALRWIGDGGAEDLGSLLGESGMSAAIRVSGDGRVIAGVSDSTEGERAVRWVDGAIENLGTVDGYEASWGRGTNADGSAIVGFVRNGDDHFAMYWSEATGMVELNSYLPSIGIDLLGWVLTDTVDVSADGRTLLGLAQYQGLVRSWSVTIPSPGVSGLMAVAGIACARRRR